MTNCPFENSNRTKNYQYIGKSLGMVQKWKSFYEKYFVRKCNYEASSQKPIVSPIKSMNNEE